MVNGIHHVR